MATLPDVDTSDVSFLAYWNILEDGGLGRDSIDPDECLDDNGITEYTLYDNGFEADYNADNHREITVRVKTDGWFVAYMDRRSTFATNVEDYEDIEGPWNIGGAFPEAYGVDGNILERAIDSLRDQISLDDVESVDYSSSDVGLYNYEVEDATTFTLMTVDGKDINVGYSYTEDTNIDYHINAGWLENYYHLEVENYGKIAEIDGGVDGNRYGVIDVIEEDVAPEPNTTYTMSSDTPGGNVVAHNLILWH